MGGRRRTRGILTTMAKMRHEKAPARRTLLQRIGFWLGAAAIVAVGAIIVVAMIGQLLNQGVAFRPYEDDTAVVEIAPAPAGSPAGTVAAAIVELKKLRVAIPLSAAQQPRVASGTKLRVKYVYAPSVGALRVESWSVAPPETPSPAK